MSWRDDRERCYMRLFNGKRCQNRRASVPYDPALPLGGTGMSNYCKRHKLEVERFGTRKKADYPECV